MNKLFTQPILNRVQDALCSDCPPVGYPTDKTRCGMCPRRAIPSYCGHPTVCEFIGECSCSPA